MMHDVEMAIRAATPTLHQIGSAARSIRTLTDGLHGLREATQSLIQKLHATSEKTDVAVADADLALKSIHTTLRPDSPLATSRILL